MVAASLSDATFKKRRASQSSAFRFVGEENHPDRAARAAAVEVVAPVCVVPMPLRAAESAGTSSARGRASIQA